MSKIIRIVTLTITIIFSVNIFTFAETSSSLQNKIDQNNNKINELQDKKNRITNELSNQNSELQKVLDEIDEKSSELETIRQEVKSYQLKIDEVQVEIDNINKEIYETEIKIESRKKLIKEKEEEALRIQKDVDRRIRSYYKIDVVTNYIYLVLKSENLLSLFNNIQAIFRIINFDKSLINEAKSIQAQLENEKLELTNQLKQIEEGKKEVIAKQEELKENQKVYLTKQEYYEDKMDELKSLESEKTNIIASLKGEAKYIESQIGDLISYNTDLQEQLDNIFADINSDNNSSSSTESNSSNSSNNSNNSNNSRPSTENNSNVSNGIVGDPNSETFLRPGSGVITDDYGPRINPVTGVAGFHTGVDLGDPYGAPVYASKTGVVVYSGWISGYGNTIILDHGSGVQTLYAHNSSLLFEVGQTVTRGQTIAYVGSTGMSTGPHIHWEIRVNGQHIDPMPYV